MENLFKKMIAMLDWYGVRLASNQLLKIYSEKKQFSSKGEIEKLYTSNKHQLFFQKNQNWYSELNMILNGLQNNGILLITFFDDSYPVVFRYLKRPPLALTVKGEVSALKLNGISIVGSRNLQSTSVDWMNTELLDFLHSTGDGVSTVSGGARGADMLVHKLSCLAGVPSLVYLPCGIYNFYPKDLLLLESDLLRSRGAFISCFHPNLTIRKYLFYERNKLIASFSSSLLLVEAARKSGSLMTARWAMELGRDIAVVPSSPLFKGRGGLDLIQQGAALICDSDDLQSFYTSSIEQTSWHYLQSHKYWMRDQEVKE